jgi:hypothetical protein
MMNAQKKKFRKKMILSRSMPFYLFNHESILINTNLRKADYHGFRGCDGYPEPTKFE